MESVVTTVFDGFYHGKEVLVTGHTGFKGGWLSLWLHHLGAKVVGISLPPEQSPNFYETLGPDFFEAEWFGDLRDYTSLRAALGRFSPDLVFHLAAQALVRRSYAAPLETLATNALGTAHLLEAIRQAGWSCPIVVITSDKCYENREWEYGYREADPLGGHDIYSMSKAATELVVQGWRQSFFEPDPRLGRIATARAGNVLGGGDYAVDRIVPDCIRSLLAAKPIEVRNPSATRPWQHVLDCLSGYLWLGASLGQPHAARALASAFNFGPGARATLTVSQVVEEILRQWPGEWRPASETRPPHEAHQLNLAIDKAGTLLKWFPVWDCPEAIRHTIHWYHQRHIAQHPCMRRYSLEQIEAFTHTAQAKAIRWARSRSVAPCS